MEVRFLSEAERKIKESELQAAGLEIIHTNFDPGWKHGDEPRGVLIAEEPEIPQLSPEELVIEAIVKETAEANDQALVLYQDWDNLTPPQQRAIVKMLLGGFISQHRLKYL